MYENLVGVTSAIGELQHTEFSKPSYLYATTVTSIVGSQAYI